MQLSGWKGRWLGLALACSSSRYCQWQAGKARCVGVTGVSRAGKSAGLWSSDAKFIYTYMYERCSVLRVNTVTSNRRLSAFMHISIPKPLTFVSRRFILMFISVRGNGFLSCWHLNKSARHLPPSPSWERKLWIGLHYLQSGLSSRQAHRDGKLFCTVVKEKKNFLRNRWKF